MAAVRQDTGLDEGPSPGLKLSDSETSLRTGDWVSSAGASTGPSFTLERNASLYAYHDLTAFRDLVQLHQGRHSTVWSAVCQQTGRTVVIKGYKRDTLKPRQLDNVQREISLLRFFRDIGCKGVVSILAAFEDKSVIYIVFEACMRGDLYQLLMRNRGTLHEEFIVTKIVFPLLGILQQLHKLHIVHRDIKPENIFISEDGDIALGDFGLAGHKFQDRMTERVGTLDYMAPEVLSIPTHDDQEPAVSSHATDGAKSYDEKVDIWAAGILVYELLVGRPPFEVEDPQETARLIMTGEATCYPVHTSHYARDFVAQALTKCPNARPSAAELLHHPWLGHYFGGRIPDAEAAAEGGDNAGLLNSWLVATWSDLPGGGLGVLKPNSVAPNRLVLSPSSTPRNALSTGDDPCPAPRVVVEDAKRSSHYARKSVPGETDAGGATPTGTATAATSLGSPHRHDRTPSKHTTSCAAAPSRPMRSGSNSLQASPEEGDQGVLDAEADADLGGANRLGASQYPSRDSSTGSLDQAVPRTYVRNDSGASGSSTISVASFASLQNVQRSNSAGDMGDTEELSMVQRSVSICPANISRLPPVAYPMGNSQLKPVWQSNTPPAGVGSSRKTPGKSRFAG